MLNNHSLRPSQSFSVSDKSTGPYLQLVALALSWPCMQHLAKKWPSMSHLPSSKTVSHFHLPLKNVRAKVGTKHPWVVGIQFCSNEGPCLFPRGDHKIGKIHQWNLKIVPISTRLNTKYPWVKGIQVYSNEGPISMGK